MVLHYCQVEVSLHVFSVVVLSVHDYSVIGVHLLALRLLMVGIFLVAWRDIRYIDWRECASLIILSIHDHSVLTRDLLLLHVPELDRSC